MSQDFVYSVLQRPPLGASNLTFKRRVAPTVKQGNSKKSASKEDDFLKEQENTVEFKDLLEEKEKSKLGSNIDDTC